MSLETLLSLFRDKGAYISEDEKDTCQHIKWLDHNRLLSKCYLDYVSCNKCIEQCSSLPLINKGHELYFLCPDDFLLGKQYIKDSERVFWSLNFEVFVSEYCQMNRLKVFNQSYYNEQYYSFGVDIEQNILHLLCYSSLDEEIIKEINEIKRDYKEIYLLTVEKSLNKIITIPQHLKYYSIEEIVENKSFKFLVCKKEFNKQIVLSLDLNTMKVIYKGQEVSFGKKKTLFQWLYVLAQRGNQGLSHKQIADELQDGILNDNQVSVIRTRILKLFKDQTSINKTEVDKLIVNQSSKLRLNLPLSQIDIIER